MSFGNTVDCPIPLSVDPVSFLVLLLELFRSLVDLDLVSLCLSDFFFQLIFFAIFFYGQFFKLQTLLFDSDIVG